MYPIIFHSQLQDIHNFYLTEKLRVANKGECCFPIFLDIIRTIVNPEYLKYMTGNDIVNIYRKLRAKYGENYDNYIAWSPENWKDLDDEYSFTVIEAASFTSNCYIDEYFLELKVINDNFRASPIAYFTTGDSKFYPVINQSDLDFLSNIGLDYFYCF